MEIKARYRWQIECSHTPETIDRILLPIRKRGICVSSLQYTQKDLLNATCIIEFEIEPKTEEGIYKNMLRIQDILSVSRLN